MSILLRLLCVTGLVGVSLLENVSAAPPPTGNPQYDAALNRGLAFLRQASATTNYKLHGGYHSLLGYALLKGGDAPETPAVKKAIDEVLGRIKDNVYKPSNDQHHIYEAGVDAMLLSDANAEQYFPQIQAISNYIVAQQGGDGSWDYPTRTVGDTSMAQYGVLGLWAAVRAGVEVPLEVWDKAAMWHLKTQQADGGFMYHPGVNVNAATGGGASSHNMSPGATGTLAVIQLHLHPGSDKPEEAEPKKVLGVLEAKAEEPDPAASRNRNYKPQISAGAINSAIQRGLGWITNRFVAVSPLPHKRYYNFAIERMGALTKTPLLGGKIDWFKECGDALLKEQETDGAWDTAEGKEVGTSLVVLFFIRATKATVIAQYGEGLLAGGRGIPKDLANADLSGGSIKEKKLPEGPLDELLTDLSKLNPDNFNDVQAAIVEKVQLGDRSELLGEIERIRKLITHPDPGIRQTAVWALGRSGDLRDANLLINALQDNNVDVLVESYNALSYLSRKISGVGLPSNPLEELGPSASQAEKDAAVNSWRIEATKRWSAWYLRIRPYAERNDLFQLKFGGTGEKK